MPAKTFTQLTNIDEQNIDNANDVFAVWDNAHATDSPQAKQLKAKNVLTSPDTSVSLQTSPAVSTTGNVSRVVCVDQTGYDSLSPKDSNTLYVITDGKTKDSYVGQIDTLANGTYTIDPYVVTDRDISRIYVAWDGTAGGTIDIQAAAATVGSQIALTGTSPSNQNLTGSEVAVTAGQAITLVAASVSNITNVRFVVEYEV